MRKVVFNLLAVAVLTTLTALTSCDKNDELSYRVVSDGEAHQTIYADQTTNNGLSFKSSTTFVWWTSIEEPEKSPWIISITPESGGATNESTIFINVEPNTSGIDREAVILMNTLHIGRTEVLVDRIYFRQLATTRDGQLYIVPDSQ